MNLLVILAVAAGMIALRFLRPGALAWLGIWWVGLYLVFKYGVDPPLPASIVNMFMGIVTIALLAFLSADSERFSNSLGKMQAFMTERRYLVPLVIVLLGIPLFAAWRVYADMSSGPEPPVRGRTIHPVPPTEISFKGQKIDLVAAHNPYRDLEETDPAAFAEHVADGRRVYYENCVFCHGDDMAGDGIFAHAYTPIPANFQDPTTIAMLQETYLFWRIAKGGPGLPAESTPWLSAMPAWELFLTEEEIWNVILFLYDYTGYRPRASEEVH